MIYWQVMIMTVSALLLVLLTLPGTIELAIVTLAGILPLSDRRAKRTAKISKLAVVIPAHNEAGAIARCVRSISACVVPEPLQTSIVVVADNCTDATADFAKASGARVLARVDAERRAKGFALQFAFQTLLEEGFDAFLIVDADSVVDSNFLDESVRLFKMGADGVQARYVVLNSDASPRTRLMNIAFMAFNVLRARGRERLGLSVGISGNGFGLSRATLQAVPYATHSLVEDLDYHLQLVEAGRKIVFADRTRVRAEMPTGGQAASTQRARWEGGRLRTAMENLPPLLGGCRPQLIEPALELLLMPLTFHVSILVLTAMMPFELARIYALCALAIVALHVTAGIVVGGGDWGDFAALLSAPFYIVWKLAALPKTLQSARSAAPWIRTER